MSIMESPARNLIGNGTVIKGDIESSGDIRIDGHLIGSLKSNGKVFIGQSGIKTDELTALKATSKVEVDLTTKQLLIEVGAQFTGKCVMGQQSTISMPKQKIG